VKIGTAAVETVSDVLYMDDQDRVLNPIYAGAGSSAKALWPSIIEVALAAHLGGYDKLKADQKDVGSFFDSFLGPKKHTIHFVELHKKKMPRADVLKMCKQARTIPTIAATKPAGTGTLMAFHGFAVLGASDDGKCALYDPFEGTMKAVKLDVVMDDVLALITVSVI
jgi:hypothetical protein